MNLTIREFLEKKRIKINKNYRSFIGRKLAKFSIEKKARYEKVKFNEHLENAYKIEILEQFFKNNPIPLKTEDYEPITLEMIKVLPIKLFDKNLTGENLTTNGINIFVGKKWIGYWI